MLLRFTTNDLSHTTLRGEDGADIYTIQTPFTHLFRPNPTILSRVGPSREPPLEAIATLKWCSISPDMLVRPNYSDIPVDQYVPKKGWPSTSRIFRTSQGNWKWSTNSGNIELYDSSSPRRLLASLSREGQYFFLNIEDSALKHLEDIIIGFIISQRDLMLRRQRNNTRGSITFISTLDNTIHHQMINTTM
ncbi:uncharacterized protein EI90DRAFT_3064602 [Cantharellus anzutake]|uniref:uncharacterized protein n=1 Tax=Cantharellus anzutake TaxID=1750568 RepID=UPI0019053BA8|nr:uncharacterized protein EI90DRAFT_3064602 [Cantharellus anzutake]KAF8328568.1 hypothetical protein EI90DRAFT_3064602 [Cantharellus anzutake]